MRELYGELFALNETIYKASDSELKGAVSRVTGKDEQTVNRVFNTFKALVSQANFDEIPAETTSPVQEPQKKTSHVDSSAIPQELNLPRRRESSFHYNIQIVLPTTTEVTVYNAIFKSLRDNLNL